MSSKFLTELSNDYKTLFESEIGYDVIIYVGEEPNVKEIHAHSSILCIRSQYFRIAFSNTWAKKEDGKFILRKQNIEPYLFDIILRFVYYGNIELKDLQGPDVLKLLIAVDELNIQSLITHIQEYLIEHQIEFLRQNPTGILETIYEHETFTDLWNFYLDKICNEPKILFNSEKFINLKAPFLELLLKRDDLNMEEIEIWNNLLKWCFAQHNVIMEDSNKWNEDDIIKIKDLLHQFTPLIRFYDIEPTDFFYKVYYYKDILPQNLIHDLLEFHIVPSKKSKINLPPSRTTIDSELIKFNHIPIFVSWIDKKDTSFYNQKRIPYKFKLLYRSNRDGFNNSTFHKLCNNKGATVWVAKILNSSQFIGGYNPLDWSGSGPKHTTDSFLFNFLNENDKEVSYINIERGADYAVYCHKNHGPKMGDLNCPDSKFWSYDGGLRYYPNLSIPKTFTVENYEVFQVIKC
ncbi:hypothetical protein C1645_841050 [Glomus cerebriforme]|uniref:BTB/POZ domain-containing protein n=1 Tax=Glomus cerebriforme TaxID=658196 RepID=A0A397RYG7_9GLOM|nr:hypothetical protein C1645_841050 [Glomus cerebriforme]